MPTMANAQPSGCADQSLRPEPLYTQQQQYRIGYTTNTRGGWEGDPFKGMSEGREVGFPLHGDLRQLRSAGPTPCTTPMTRKA